jgi:hypothetical protein
VTTFPGSPRLRKGALVGLDLPNPVASVVMFQYNPERLTRTLQAQTTGGEGGRAEAFRLKGAPIETIDVEVEIDAADQLERGDQRAAGMGIYPQLSALEMLIYPKSLVVIANTVLLALGTIEVIPPVAPLTLFIWGEKRILPVQVTELSIAEEMHDAKLNPIRATVSLGLRVLTYDDLAATHPGFGLFLAHQVTKEVMATIGSLNDLSAVTGGNVNLF